MLAGVMSGGPPASHGAGIAMLVLVLVLLLIYAILLHCGTFPFPDLAEKLRVIFISC